MQLALVSAKTDASNRLVENRPLNSFNDLSEQVDEFVYFGSGWCETERLIRATT